MSPSLVSGIVRLYMLKGAGLYRIVGVCSLTASMKGYKSFRLMLCSRAILIRFIPPAHATLDLPTQSRGQQSTDGPIEEIDDATIRRN